MRPRCARRAARRRLVTARSPRGAPPKTVTARRSAAARASEALVVAPRGTRAPAAPGVLSSPSRRRPRDARAVSCAPSVPLPAPPSAKRRYRGLDESGAFLNHDAIFVYDLALPADFEPAALDGEVCVMPCHGACVSGHFILAR